ncbi:hypothetical protein BASA62_005193 [Batrachochytrium salamandrivorans]|nr:hypothetical protein BASA62_005193 [Batrachochytrium salamandrivorans]
MECHVRLSPCDAPSQGTNRACGSASTAFNNSMLGSRVFNHPQFDPSIWFQTAAMDWELGQKRRSGVAIPRPGLSNPEPLKRLQRWLLIVCTNGNQVVGRVDLGVPRKRAPQRGLDVDHFTKKLNQRCSHQSEHLHGQPPQRACTVSSPVDLAATQTTQGACGTIASIALAPVFHSLKTQLDQVAVGVLQRRHQMVLGHQMVLDIAAMLLLCHNTNSSQLAVGGCNARAISAMEASLKCRSNPMS